MYKYIIEYNITKEEIIEAKNKQEAIEKLKDKYPNVQRVLDIKR